MSSAKTWADNDVLTDGDMNTYVRDNAHAQNCRANNSGAISVSNASWTLITFDSERFDVDGMHNTSSNTGRFVAQRTGRYWFGCCIRWASDSSGYRGLQARLNSAGSGSGGTELAQVSQPPVNGTYTQQSLTSYYTLTAGDYVEFFGFQSSGGALNIEASSNTSPEGWMAFHAKS